MLISALFRIITAFRELIGFLLDSTYVRFVRLFSWRTEEECLYHELKEIIEKDTPGRAPRISGGPLKALEFLGQPDLRAYDEVWPGIYIGKGTVAGDEYELNQMKITHVVNAAHGDRFAQVNTDPSLYVRHHIQFFSVPALDSVDYHLSQFFYQTSQFIREAVHSGGVVYVHCHQGCSRSATLVLAHLMISSNLSVQTALRTVRQKRKIVPNDGFLKQLCELELDLRKQRRIKSS